MAPVRPFPRPARRRIATALLVAVTVGGLSLPLVAPDSVPFAAASESGKLKKRHQQVEGRIDAAHDALEDSSGALRAATAKLRTAQAALVRAKAQLASAEAKLGRAQALDAQMQAKLVAAQQRLTEARAALERGQSAVKQQRRKVASAITATYQQGDPQLLAVGSFLDSDGFQELVDRQRANETVVSRQKRQYAELRASEVILTVREGDVEDAAEVVAQQRKVAAAHLVTMQALAAHATTARNQVASSVAARSTAQLAARQAKAHDLVVLRKLEQQEARIRQRLLEEARKARGGFKGRTGGLFDMPVNAPITSPFGYRIHPIYHYWGLHNGTDFGADCGTAMHAIGDGKVVAKMWSDVYGNRLYVSLGNVNGKNITAVYNHATRYTVGVGERVRRGETVGYVGMTGWSTGCHLHFIILKNGTAVNPMGYL